MPATYEGSPYLMLFDRTIMLILSSRRVARDAAMIGEAGEKVCRVVMVSSLSKIISSACFIFASITKSGKEERISVGLNFFEAPKKSAASRNIDSNLIIIAKNTASTLSFHRRPFQVVTIPYLCKFFIEHSKTTSPFNLRLLQLLASQFFLREFQPQLFLLGCVFSQLQFQALNNERKFIDSRLSLLDLLLQLEVQLVLLSLLQLLLSCS